jgi:hypothetical protein
MILYSPEEPHPLHAGYKKDVKKHSVLSFTEAFVLRRVCWVVTTCRFVGVYVSEESAACIFRIIFSTSVALVLFLLNYVFIDPCVSV